MPRLALRVLTGFERLVKSAAFGCQMCGQCILQFTGFVCPMQCPKNLRNGPCGGVRPDGSCEVDGGGACCWHQAYTYAEATGQLAALSICQPPIDWRLQGTSAWLNHWRNADAHIPYAQLNSRRRQIVGAMLRRPWLAWRRRRARAVLRRRSLVAAPVSHNPERQS
ncbi:MAG: methylenetetrahydrofolate reductase C-terminal domain-containing protein [Candidatus Tectomicrobia bacterium]|nr:methylenetetrahydrofolate reductase C-terminal domain-containing protein [Candidatus Tectomicrobia bacterium]